MSKKKSIFLRIILIIGILIYFYPNISDYVNSFSSSTSIISYNKALSEYENVDKEKIKKEAQAYNEDIFKQKDAIYNPNIIEGYENRLNPFNDGMMAYLTIEKIGLNLPIYHGVSDPVMRVGVGHLPGTSLPIGGKSTHSVLSSHSGLPDAKLFTDLNQLKEGDEFIISVLDENLYYKVDQIKTVLPKEIEDLKVVEGKDYVTLFTCTPYGINTHRLLVRGERIKKDNKYDKKIEENIKKNMISSVIKLIIMLVIIVFIIVTIVIDLIKIKTKL